MILKTKTPALTGRLNRGYSCKASGLDPLAERFTRTLRLPKIVTTLSPLHVVDFPASKHHCQVNWYQLVLYFSASGSISSSAIAGHLRAKVVTGVPIPPEWPIGGSRHRTDNGAKIQQLLRIQHGLAPCKSSFWHSIARGRYRPSDSLITNHVMRLTR